MFREGQHAKHAQPRDDNIKDGTEDANHNGKIDGDNGDGVYSESEIWTETNPNSWDTDQDSIRDNKEIEYGYDPLSNDTDGDGLNETEEDVDGDGELDYEETDPTDTDTDNDGLNDNLELKGWTVLIIFEATKEKKSDYNVFSDPRDFDSDNDGLNDYQEYKNTTDPYKSDSDEDGKTDIQELNGDYNSSATGIDGEPPEIWHFDCGYEASGYKGLGPLKIPTKLKAYVEVGAKDIFGIKYIHVDIRGLEDKSIITNNQKNITQKFEWTISGLSKIKRSVWDGFKLNVSVKDRNNNIGFKENEIGSIKDIVLSFFIGTLLSIVKIIMAFVDLLISLITDLAEIYFNIMIEPVVNGINKMMDLITTPLQNIIIFLVGDEEETKNNWRDNLSNVTNDIVNVFEIISIGAIAFTGIMLLVQIIELLVTKVLDGVSGGAATAATNIGTLIAEMLIGFIIGFVISSVINALKVDNSIKSLKQTKSILGKIVAVIAIIAEVIGLISIFSEPAVYWETGFAKMKAAFKLITKVVSGVFFSLVGLLIEFFSENLISKLDTSETIKSWIRVFMSILSMLFEVKGLKDEFENNAKNIARKKVAPLTTFFSKIAAVISAITTAVTIIDKYAKGKYDGVQSTFESIIEELKNIGVISDILKELGITG